MNRAEGLTVLVVDDELLARQRLEDLAGTLPRVARVLTATSGQEAVRAIRDSRPELVFLDMQMPGMSGLDVVRAVGPGAMPITIFVTAHDQYAVQAFEVAALDYLLKPFDDERFQNAFDRAVRHLELEEVGQAAERMSQFLDDRPGIGRAAAISDAPPGRIAVDSGGTVHVVALSNISHITAAGPYAELHTPDRTYLIRETMNSLEDRLARDGFARVHRSSIVRLDQVNALNRGSGGDYSLTLSDGTGLSVSRARINDLERRLGVQR